MAKMYLFVGTKIPMEIMITAFLASDGYSVLTYAKSGFTNNVFTISFFPHSYNMYDVALKRQKIGFRSIFSLEAKTIHLCRV